MKSMILIMALLGLGVGCDTVQQASLLKSPSSGNGFAAPNTFESLSAAQASSANSGSGKVFLNSYQSELFMSAMERSGVVDSDKLLGAKNLKVRHIDCERAIGPSVTPTCWLTMADEGVRTAAHEDASLFYQAILNAGGLVFTGRADLIKVIADGVECSRPVVPNPEAHCEFSVNLRND